MRGLRGAAVRGRLPRAVIYPALRAIGEDWAAGRQIDVAMEHAASEAIRTNMGPIFYDAAGSDGNGRQNRSTWSLACAGLCGTEIGAMGFAVAARRRGLSVLYLGANVPVDSWALTSDALGMAVAVVGAASALGGCRGSARGCRARSDGRRPDRRGGRLPRGEGRGTNGGRRPSRVARWRRPGRPGACRAQA